MVAVLVASGVLAAALAVPELVRASRGYRFLTAVILAAIWAAGIAVGYGTLRATDSHLVASVVTIASTAILYCGTAVVIAIRQVERFGPQRPTARWERGFGAAALSFILGLAGLMVSLPLHASWCVLVFTILMLSGLASVPLLKSGLNGKRRAIRRMIHQEPEPTVDPSGLWEVALSFSRLVTLVAIFGVVVSFAMDSGLLLIACGLLLLISMPVSMIAQTVLRRFRRRVEWTLLHQGERRGSATEGIDGAG
jgi:hypothetical protein